MARLVCLSSRTVAEFAQMVFGRVWWHASRAVLRKAEGGVVRVNWTLTSKFAHASFTDSENIFWTG